MRNVLLKVSICGFIIASCFAISGFANTDIQLYANDDVITEQTMSDGVYTPDMTRDDIAEMNAWADSINGQFTNIY